MIVVATITGDTIFPATAVWVQRKLVGCRHSTSMRRARVQLGWRGAAFITAGMAGDPADGAEIFNRIIDYTDRGTILFGDGAGRGGAGLEVAGIEVDPRRRQERREDPLDARGRHAHAGLRRTVGPATTVRRRTGARSSAGRAGWRGVRELLEKSGTRSTTSTC
jgi:hypothetical protein